MEISQFLTLSVSILIVLILSGGRAYAMRQGDEQITHHHRVRRGNYGSRYSGGLGAGSSHGAGYGGVGVVGAQVSGQGGSYLVFDSIAQKAIAGPSNDFMNSYQAQLNAGASSAAGLDHLQQGGQHAAAYAGSAANQASQQYNSAATGPVSPTYKGEYLRRRR